MIIDPTQLNNQERYKLMTGSVLPRPIAWVSTMDAVGQLNLAPFSYFSAVCPTPMTLLFCPGVHPDGRKKDTWANIEQVPEFVVNITNEDTAVQMNLSATLLSSEQSEFEWAGVTPAPSEVIRVPRVAEAPIAFECVLDRIAVVSEQPGGGAAIFGQVQRIHIRDDLFDNGRVNTELLRPIGRLAGDAYVRATDILRLKRVPPPDERPKQ